MTPCFGHTGVTFDVLLISLVAAAFKVILRPLEAIFVFDKNGWQCPVWNGRPRLVWNGSLLWACQKTFDAENDKPGPGSLRGHFEAARGRF